MKDYLVYERISPILGREHDEFLGVIRAQNMRSALNKARKTYKVDRGGVPARRRIADNFWATPLGS